MQTAQVGSKIEMNEDATMILNKNRVYTLHCFPIKNHEKSPFSLRGYNAHPHQVQILNECPTLIVSQDGKLPAATLKWDLNPQWEYQFCECGPFL